MEKNFQYKRKILNDPIYGFITLPYEIVSRIMEHSYFQRLRRIKQLGVTSLVYPGALHTRFHHALGAMHLMGKAIEVIRSKGYEITHKEAVGVTLAVLLHDIGHGPFSHALENSIVGNNITHENLSEIFMHKLNKEFQGELSLAIKIFKNEYSKKFLYQLVSSQLDMDRLDYLNRDSFYTGVPEGIINADRIITMLTVANDGLAIEAKGIYSIEKFIIARRLMYWQVYLHKTVLSSEYLLVNILKRAKELANSGKKFFTTPSLSLFLSKKFTKEDFERDDLLLQAFADLDDSDIDVCIKVWMKCDDFVLSKLCSNMVNRKLFKVELQDIPFDNDYVEEVREKVKKIYMLSSEEVAYFVFTNSIKNDAYSPNEEKINILYRDGKLMDVAETSDQLSISVLSKTVEKFFLCYPKEITLK